MNIDFKYKYIKYKLKYLEQKNNNFKGGGRTEVVVYKSNTTNKILHNNDLVNILNNLKDTEKYKYNNNISYKKDNERIIETNIKKNYIECDYFEKTTILLKDFSINIFKKKKKPKIILFKNICDKNKIIDGIDWFNDEFIEIFNNSNIETLTFFIYKDQEYYLHIFNLENKGYSYYLYIIVDKIHKIIFLKLFFFYNNNGQTKLVLSAKERNILWDLYYLHNIIKDNNKTILLKKYHYDIVDILRLYGYLEENNEILNILLKKLFTGKCIPIKKNLDFLYKVI